MNFNFTRLKRVKLSVHRPLKQKYRVDSYIGVEIRPLAVLILGRPGNFRKLTSSVSQENQKFAVLGRHRPRLMPSPGSLRPRTSSPYESEKLVSSLKLS